MRPRANKAVIICNLDHVCLEVAMCVRACVCACVYFTVSLTCCSEMYVKEVRTGLCDGKAVPVVVKETPATAYVNGNNGIGTVSNPSSDILCKQN